MISIKSITLLAWLLSATIASAALPPGSTDQMKANADEKLLISVDSATPLLGQPAGCITNTMVTATVVSVQSGQDYKPGDQINFSSYYYNPNSSACQGFVGPPSPPHLEAGWCGLAYLNLGATSEAPLTLAAYGDGLEQEPSYKCSTEAPTQPPTKPLPPTQPPTEPLTADEVLLVSIETVFQFGQPSDCIQTYEFQANVIEVDQTKLGFVPGDIVYFTMPHLNDELNCLPTDDLQTVPPPDFGWCGYVYLNDGYQMNKQGALELESLHQVAGDNTKCRTGGQRKLASAPGLLKNLRSLRGSH